MVEFINEIFSDLQCFLYDLGFLFLGKHIKVILIGLFGTGILPVLFRLALIIKAAVKSYALAMDLHPYFEYPIVSNAVKYFVRTRAQDINPNNEFELSDVHSGGITNYLIDTMLKHGFSRKSNRRFYLILGDSGMGKTTFMINLYARYKRKLGKDFNIVLLPVVAGIEKEIARRARKENTILLLDALDEDPEALQDINGRLHTLVNAAAKYRKVVVSCRTQFFSSESNIPKETELINHGSNGKGRHLFTTLYISPFDTGDIGTFLNKKYGILRFWNWGKKRRAWSIIKKTPNLMVRPMLLSYIDDLLQVDQTFTYRYPHNIYEILIDKWLQRETDRLPMDQQDGYKDKLLLFSQEVAIDIYNNRITDGFYIEDARMTEIAQKNNINLDVLVLKGRSLLNANTDGKVKFAHKSIMEYFIARYALQREEFEVISNGNIVAGFPSGIQGIDQAKIFLTDMIAEMELTETPATVKLNNIQVVRKYFGHGSADVGLRDWPELDEVMKNGEKLDRNDLSNLYSQLSRGRTKSIEADISGLEFLIQARNSLDLKGLADCPYVIDIYPVSRHAANEVLMFLQSDRKNRNATDFIKSFDRVYGCAVDRQHGIGGRRYLIFGRLKPFEKKLRIAKSWN